MGERQLLVSEANYRDKQEREWRVRSTIFIILIIFNLLIILLLIYYYIDSLDSY